jgi:hypothetical protein
MNGKILARKPKVGLRPIMTSKKPARMSAAQKYASLKRQTEEAGMSVQEKGGKIVVTRKKKRSKA